MSTANTATAKLKMLRDSTRCLVDGLLGFIPIIGLGFALTALWISGRVRRQEKQFWNAAKPYRIIGVACASVATILWAGILLFIFGNILASAIGL